jgi:RNA polymerase sigma-70 factor (ECF subfamily)
MAVNEAKAQRNVRRDLTSPEAFEAVVREHQGMVFRTLTRMTGAGGHVEDLAQEVFLRLYRALPEFRADAMLSTYLYRIVVNVAQDEWKRRKKEREHRVEPPAFVDEEGEAQSWMENFAGDADAGDHARSPERRLELAQMERAVEGGLQALPEMERAVIVLYHQEELSYEGIAAALNLPINTVRTHLHRGRKRLGELLRGATGTRAEAGNAEVRQASPAEARRRTWRWAS